MKRRQFVAAAGAASVSLAGCIGASMPTDAVVRAVQKSPPADVAVVSADTVSQAEQQIVQTAVEQDVYHACPELPDAVHAFADRFGQPDSAYLQHQGTTYALWIRIEDTVRAGTASPPERDPSCGFL